MSEFAQAAEDIATAFDTDLSEQVVAITYKEIETGTEHQWRGVAETIKQYETDGESVTMQTGKWFCLRKELPIEPQIDDTITINGNRYYIARVDPVDQVVGWSIYANG